VATRTALRRLLVVLMVAGLAVVVASAGAVQAMRATATEVGTRTAPSIVDSLAARAALVEADAAAVQSFRSGEVALSGPGERYQSQIAVASQSLAQLAEHNVAGPAASQAIQLVEGLLVAYMGLIEQADAHFRQSRGTALGTADLWYASRLVHAPESGLLAQLDALREAQTVVLGRQLDSGGAAPGWRYAWPLAGLLLLLTLVATQVFLSRRFRRTVNPALLGATVLLVVLGTAMWSTVSARHELSAAQHALGELGTTRTAQSGTVDRQGQQALLGLVRDSCPTRDRCGDTVDGVDRQVRAADPGPAAPPDEDAVTAGVRTVNAHTAAAGDLAEPQLLVLVAALGILGLIPLGLYPRLDEYRRRIT
jgi:hypothetical protein